MSNFLELETFIARLGRNLVQREKFSQPGNRQVMGWVRARVLPPNTPKTPPKMCLRRFEVLWMFLPCRLCFWVPYLVVPRSNAMIATHRTAPGLVAGCGQSRKALITEQIVLFSEQKFKGRAVGRSPRCRSAVDVFCNSGCASGLRMDF